MPLTSNSSLSWTVCFDLCVGFRNHRVELQLVMLWAPSGVASLNSGWWWRTEQFHFLPFLLLHHSLCVFPCLLLCFEVERQPTQQQTTMRQKEPLGFQRGVSLFDILKICLWIWFGSAHHRRCPPSFPLSQLISPISGYLYCELVLSFLTGKSSLPCCSPPGSLSQWNWSPEGFFYVAFTRSLPTIRQL